MRKRQSARRRRGSSKAAFVTRLGQTLRYALLLEDRPQAVGRTHMHTGWVEGVAGFKTSNYFTAVHQQLYCLGAETSFSVASEDNRHSADTL